MKNVQTKNRAFARRSTRAAIVSTALVTAFVMGGLAKADDDSGLYAWARAADQSVDEVMVYPSIALRRSQTGRSVFEVTVDRSGQVVGSDLVENFGAPALKSAARRVLRQAEFPALPANYRGEQLTFSLRLNYLIAGSEMEARALRRSARVRGEPVSSGRIASGAISISANAFD